MASETKNAAELKIAYVLFMDIVGYSKLKVDEQRELVERLKQVVRGTTQFQKADAENRLTKIPTGDGMALIFYNNPEVPVECALEICRALKHQSTLPLRMGVHSGPVSGILDVNDAEGVAGAGINLAQRVMDCGDAGHILLSKHVAEDLEEYGQWRQLLHDLGTCEVKHGVRVSVVNLYGDQIGNATLPKKFQALKKRGTRVRWTAIAAALLAIAVIIAGSVMFSRHRVQSPLGAPEKSIAVLPFENLSSDNENAYFATGIQDEILTRLAKIAALKVISHTSTQQYAARPGNLSEIGQQLGVANILEGSVQRADNEVHINVQLIRAATDEHLWAESYDRKLENIFGVEGEVATAVAQALNAQLTGAEQHALRQKPTSNPDAYSAYLRGLALQADPTKLDDVVQARKSLEEAVRLDPNFAVAWAVLAQMNSDYYWVEATPERRATAENALDAAVRLQPDLPEVQLAKGAYQYDILHDFDGAKRTFQQLETKLPNNSDLLEDLGWVTLFQGQWQESRTYFDKAVELNPRVHVLRTEAAWVRVITRDFEGALRCYDQALEIWPDEELYIAAKASVYQSLGDLEQADGLLKKLPRTSLPAAVSALCQQAKLRRRYAGGIGILQACLGQTDDPWRLYHRSWLLELADFQRLSGNNPAAQTTYSQARDQFEQLLKEEPGNADSTFQALAKIYAGLGNKELSNSCIERAINLTPASKNASEGPSYEETRARIASRFGQKDVAMPILEHLLKTSYSDPITPAILRLDPDFDLLRGDPRFQKLCEQSPSQNSK